MKSKVFFLIAVFGLLFAAMPLFASDKETSPVAAVSFGAGTISGGSEFSGNHLLFGGGFDYYPFHKKNTLLQRFALSVGFSRANLGASEEFYSDFGPSRFSNRETQAELGVRVDVLKVKSIEVSLYAMGALGRQTQVFQVLDESGLRDRWRSITQYGYQCGSACESYWNKTFGKGISVGYVIHLKDYRGEKTRASLTVPEIKLMSFGDKTAITVGMRYSF